MSLLIAFLLGVVQGITEFFPISSSTHIKLIQLLCDVKKMPLAFDLCCHLGTLFALLWFLKKDIAALFGKEKQKLFYLCVALLPLLPSYYFLAPLREMLTSLKFLGFTMMGTGGILFLGQTFRLKKKKSLLYDILLIGTMQSTALIPGISRSASTISAAQILGWEVKDAVRFSFLLAIPTILGGNVIEIEKLWQKDQLSLFWNLSCWIGFFTSFIVGLFVVRFAMHWLEKGKLKTFGWYCLTLGILVNIYVYLR